jgi:branched-chain amino acid transport system permease protein
MPGRLPFAVLILAFLAGCGADERQLAICRDVAALIETPAKETAAEGGALDGKVTIRAADALGRRTGVECRFGGGRWSAGRLDLMELRVDGAPMSPVRLALLRGALGLPFPASLLPDPVPAVRPAAAFAYLLQQLVNGIVLGAVLALVAVGYALVYAVTGTIQFAYGEIYMIGAVLAALLLGTLGGLASPPLALAAAVPAVAVAASFYGGVAERLVYRPLRGRGTLAPLIAAVGLATVLREYVRLAQGAGNKWVPPLLPGRFVLYEGGGFTVLLGHAQLLIVALIGILSLALVWLQGRTRFGRAFRACADDPGMAAMLGVDVDRTIAAVFVLGAAVASVAGLAVVVYYGEADFFMGYLVGFKALTAALLGGFGSLGGALLGGLLIGLFEALWSAYFGLAYKDAAIFALLVIVLVFRPAGLFGDRAGAAVERRRV